MIKKIVFQKNNSFYNPRISKWIFFSLLIAFSFIYNYHNILTLSPQSAHLWRQCDCLSLSMGYYNGGNSFFEPSLFNLGEDGTGKTASDFPLIYYSVGKLWKVFGQHESIYRIIVIFLFFTGLFALFKSIELLLKDSIIALFGALLMFTSPTLIYYGNNFLMDIPAFSFALIGLYFFVLFILKSKEKNIYLFAICFTLAGLLKISSLISFIAICGLYVLDRFNVNFLDERKIFNKPLKHLLILISVLIVVFSWYLYAARYNRQHNSGFFLIGILPIWELDAENIRITFRAIWDHIKWDYFRVDTQLMLVFMFVTILLYFKRLNKAVALLTVLISIGFLLYIILFFQPLRHHDYYTINLFILVPFVLVSFFMLLKKLSNKVYTHWMFKAFLLLFLLLNVYSARRHINWRFNPESWQMENYIKNMSRMDGIQAYLEEIGIQNDDKIISISDNSISISLFYLGYKGWTNYGISDSEDKLKARIDMGAEYLIVYDPEDLKKTYLQPFIQNKIGEYNEIKIFKL